MLDCELKSPHLMIESSAHYGKKKKSTDKLVKQKNYEALDFSLFLLRAATDYYKVDTHPRIKRFDRFLRKVNFYFDQ